MAVVVCIAGLQQKAIEEASRSRARYSLGDQGGPIWFPSRTAGYSGCDKDRYLKALEKRVRELPSREPVNIFLLYADFGGEPTEAFVGGFFPFGAAVGFEPFDIGGVPKHERRKRMKQHLADVAASLKRLEKRVSLIRGELSGNNFSPLTLPVLNFKSDVLESRLRFAFDGLGTWDDAGKELGSLKAKISRCHPLRRIKTGNGERGRDREKPFFEDANRKRFKSPGNDLHGVRGPSDKEHLPVCLLAARSRLGGPIKSGFHYDCDKANGSMRNEKLFNCEGQKVKCPRATHANIGPNDAVW